MAKKARTKPGEVWAKVEGYEGCDDYYISNFGRFKKGDYIRTRSKNKDGYEICYVGRTTCLVHRLVAKAFVPNPDNLPVVDHINEKKTDNRADNLRWTTIQDNVATAHEKRKERGVKKNYVRTEILAIDSEDNVYLYDNRKEAALGVGVNVKLVDKIINGIMHTTKGWRFVKAKTFTDKRSKANVEKDTD